MSLEHINRCALFFKFSLAMCLLAVLLGSAWWLHLFQRSTDLAIEKELMGMRPRVLTRFSSIDGGAWDFVCFLGKYQSVASLNLGAKVEDELGLYINGFVGEGDHVWWIFTVKDGALKDAFRISKPSPAKAKDQIFRGYEEGNMGVRMAQCALREKAFVLKIDVGNNEPYVGLFEVSGD
ncbi:hypothetical protein [Pseudomonas sp. PIC25]|uniref:hypothetical protein n=1 Tax=Pseudomonas sp. PIC25 TaxID=1958773 RepID=UPI00117AEDEA|nr:hypothetical protein [Pseudomonas sp. PIC25]